MRMLLSYCPGRSPCDPCKPPPVSGTPYITVPIAYAYGWYTGYICGAAYTIAWYGTSPGGPPYNLPYPGQIPKTPESDPTVYYGIALGTQHNVPITVGGVYVGTLGSGSQSTVYLINYSGQVVSDQQMTIGGQAVLVRTQQDCNSYQINLSAPGGQITLDPTQMALYQQHHNQTDPLVVLGGPIFQIRFE